MNRHETSTDMLERHQRAVADLRLDQEADEESQGVVIQEAARRATNNSWPEMPEDDRKRVVEAVIGFEALSFQLSIFRRGWSRGTNAERVQLDPETAGPRILIRAYATAEAETLRMRTQVLGPPADAGPQASLEDRLRRYLRPNE